MSRRSPSNTTGTLGASGSGLTSSSPSVLGPRAPPLPRRRAPNLYVANPDSDEEDERDLAREKERERERASEREREQGRRVSGGSASAITSAGSSGIGQGSGIVGTSSNHSSPQLGHTTPTPLISSQSMKPPLRVITQPPTPGFPLERISSRSSPDLHSATGPATNLSPLSRPSGQYSQPQSQPQSPLIPPLTHQLQGRAQPPALPSRSTWSPTEHLSPLEGDFGSPSSLAYTHSSQGQGQGQPFRLPGSSSASSKDNNMHSSIPKPTLTRRADTSPISAGTGSSSSQSHTQSQTHSSFLSMGIGSLPPGAEPPRTGSVPNTLAAKIKQDRTFTSDRDRSNLPRLSTPPTIPLPPPPTGAVPVNLGKGNLAGRGGGAQGQAVGLGQRVTPHTMYPSAGGSSQAPHPHPSQSLPPSQSYTQAPSISGDNATIPSPSSPSNRGHPISATSINPSSGPNATSHPSRSASQPVHPHPHPPHYQSQSQPQQRLHALPALPTYNATSKQAQGQTRMILGNVRLAVTTDGESFSVVDVSGVETAEAILERVFAKLRFRDDDHPTLAMFRTDIGEQPDANAIGMPALFDLCQKEGDSKGGLKFLVVQNALPLTPSSSVVPPPLPLASVANQENIYYMSSPAEESRKTFSQSSQSNAGHAMGHDPSGRPRRSEGRHSKEGSLSSASDLWGRQEHATPSPSPGTGSAHDDGPFESSPMEPHPYSGQHPLWREKESGSGGLTRQHKLTPQRQRLPSSSTSRSSRSPVDNRYAGNRPFASPYDTSGSSSITSLSTGGPSRLKANPSEHLPGEATPTYPTHTSRKGGESPPIYLASPPSVSPHKEHPVASGSKRSYGSPNPEYRWQKSPSDPTEADLAMIAKLEREEQEKDRQKQLQMQEDARVAMLEQQKEQAAWEMAQAQERESRQRQVEDDRRAAEVSLQQERDLQAARARREAETADRLRERQVGRERKERRLQWEQRNQIARVIGDGTLSSIAPAWPTYGAPESGLAGVGAGRATLEPLFVTTGGPGEGTLDGTLTASTIAAMNNTFIAPDGTTRVRNPSAMSTHAPPPRRSLDRNRPEQSQAQGTYSSAQPSHDRPVLITPAFAIQHGTSTGQLFGQPESVLRWQQGVAASDPRDTAFEPVRPSPTMLSDDGRFPSGTRSNDSMRSRRQEDPDIISPMGGVPIYRPSPEFSRSFGRTPGTPYSDTYEGSALDDIYQDDAARDVRSMPDQRDGDAHRARYHLDVTHAQASTLDFPVPVPYSGDRRGSEGGTFGVPVVDSPMTSRRASLGATNSPSLDAIASASTPLNRSPGQGYGSTLHTLDRRDNDAERSSSLHSGRTVQQSPKGKLTGESEDNSGDTARAGDWAKDLQNLLQTSNGGTLMPPKVAHGGGSNDEDVEDQPEETLFFIPPSAGITADEGTLIPPRPQLQVDTGSRGTLATSPSLGSMGTSEEPLSVTDSDDAGESLSAATPGVKRNKSFAKTRDQWNFRPPAEDVYENLEEFFPKIDLDKPVVEAELMIDPLSPQSGSPLPSMADESGQQEALQARSKFNKAENRKSIRVVAEGRKKHLSRIAPAAKPQLAVPGPRQPKRSSSMWGHKVIEVTPAKIKKGQKLGESADGGPVTMTWVKGDLIGKGTYGRVYLALNATTGDMIAVKQVEMPRTESDREDARQSGMIEALKSEIALLKDMDHPNVVSYLGWEESPRYLSIFLEYVPGGSVASVYRKHKKFEEAVIKSFTKQILDGLAYLHSLHILHRDLKADNILVDPSGVCKISDFGISKRADDAYDSMISTNLKGSVFWMAPEVVHSVKGQGYSAKVDIWSLGCCVLEMWAGRRPWGDMEALAAMFQLANARSAPPVPDDVTLSVTADDFLNKKCFASNPRDRPTAVELLQHAFITEVDPSWTFAESGIGKAVAAGMKRR